MNRIYWVDSKSGFIFSSKRDSTDRQALIDVSNQQVENIAIDWIAENIYWTSQKSKVIEVARLNGSFRYVVINEDLDSPKAIAVDPRVGFLFWSENGERMRIERALMDGSERKVIYSSSNVALITDLIIDYTRNKLIWCDQYNSMILKSDYDGFEVEVIAVSALQPYSIDLRNDVIYWIEQ